METGIKLDADSPVLKAQRQQGLDVTSAKCLNFTIFLIIFMLAGSIVYLGLLVMILEADPALYGVEIIGVISIDMILVIFALLLGCFYSHRQVNFFITHAALFFVGMLFNMGILIYVRYIMMLLISREEP